MAQRTELIGLKEANRALKKLPDFAKAKAQDVMDVTAFNVSQGAQRRVRRRTGQLAGDISWQRRPRSLSAVVGVAARSFYWKFLEYGTVKMAAKPFVRPAAEAEADTFEKRIRDVAASVEDNFERKAA